MYRFPRPGGYIRAKAADRREEEEMHPFLILASTATYEIKEKSLN